MRAFGAEVDHQGARFEVTPKAYVATDYNIEVDASAASYFWAAAAITGGSVTVKGLNRHALAGRRALLRVPGGRWVCQVDDALTTGSRWSGGPLRGIDVDMRAHQRHRSGHWRWWRCLRKVSTHIRNVGNIRLKENRPSRGARHRTTEAGCIRRRALRMGIEVITPGPPQAASIATYDDHRMAMSFAVAGLRIHWSGHRRPRLRRQDLPALL